jgi:peptidoglycan hydrolase-like protein with peptidoglycan-binding domain
MSTPEQRMRMAKQIVDFEARRDKKGHLQVYKLPAWDKAEELATEYADRRSRAASPALRLGSRGAMVKAWEVFLIGEKLDPGEPDGMFTDKTAEATRAFQAKTKVEADGVVGRQTMRKALERGFELMEEPAADATSSNFPPRPSFPPLVSNAQRQAIFGSYA